MKPKEAVEASEAQATLRQINNMTTKIMIITYLEKEKSNEK